MPAVLRPSMSVRGLSFSIPDLILLRSWALAQGSHMTIHLDYRAGGVEYEELLAFSEQDGTPCQSIMWRDGEMIFVQSPVGQPRPYNSAADLIQALSPEERIMMTDIEPTGWPM